MNERYDYDTIIIGAGIGGLVCGCYLAKAGLRTLIVEKNAKPGGYCTSFAINEFNFDSCVHSLGSCRQGGNIAIILKDLKLESKLVLNRCNPSDVIITPDYKISFWSDSSRTIHDFQKYFPEEAKRIEDFFKDLVNIDMPSLVSLRNKTFLDLLNQYFDNEQLKAILSLPVLGNMGIAPSLVSAFSALKLYREFMLDGGYYPKGGVQTLPDVLAMQFKESGGVLLLANGVKKIKVKNKRAEGVVLENNDFKSARYVVSNIDAMQTFSRLLGEEVIGGDFLNKLSSMELSLSMFILYLGFDKNLKDMPREGVNTWYLPHYDLEKICLSAKNRNSENIAEFMVHAFSEKNMSIFINAHFADCAYWNGCKKQLSDELIRKVEKIIPNLSSHIIYKQSATPWSLYKSTSNYKGAAYGWAGTPSQFSIPGLSQMTAISNLYLSGHWTTLAQGIGGVAYLGKDTAKMILAKQTQGYN